jgi:hypothetical protein
MRDEPYPAAPNARQFNALLIKAAGPKVQKRVVGIKPKFGAWLIVGAPVAIALQQRCCNAQ